MPVTGEGVSATSPVVEPASASLVWVGSVGGERSADVAITHANPGSWATLAPRMIQEQAMRLAAANKGTPTI